MATQKKTTAKTTAAKPTTVSAWRKANVRKPTELPSGNYATLRLGSMELFLGMGFIPNALKGLVQKAIAEVDPNQKKKKAAPEAELAKLLEDESALADLIKMYDKIAIYCFQEPKLQAVPLDDDGNEIPMEDREDTDTLYVDEIDFDDKVFTFQVAVGGTKDLESFRRQQAASVGSVLEGSEVEGST